MEFDKIVEIISDSGHDVRSYSGRYMYGKECLGVTCDDPIRFVLDVMVYAHSMCVSDSDPVFEKTASILKNYRTDDMGKRQIIYFPEIAWEGDDSQNDEDDDE